MPSSARLLLTGVLLAITSGCTLLLPETSTMPVVKNPFPQLQRVAIAPFLNLSDEPTVDGRLFAQAYFSELQATAGFEVVPLGVVEEAMIAESIDLSAAGDARRLAQILGVDVVVVGAVTDYKPYYPPRCGLRVEWYAANPGFHKIPAGYGLPWGTPDEEYIPGEVVYQAELELATAQMDTQSPAYTPDTPPQFHRVVPTPPMGPIPSAPADPQEPAAMPQEEASDIQSWRPQQNRVADDPQRHAPLHRTRTADRADDATSPGSADNSEHLPWGTHTVRKSTNDASLALPAPVVNGTDGTIAQGEQKILAADLPPHWPDPRGFVPPGPSSERPGLVVNSGPIMTHTRVFHGHDPEFTTALAAYVDFRDDARFGGWRAYLTRSDDFIRFCCHLHIVEMLGARGGASETRVVRHWSDCR
jgi:hypothetical protein